MTEYIASGNFELGPMYDDLGNQLEGIQGAEGATGELESMNLILGADGNHRDEMGLDHIVMKPGTQFPLHTHPGSHILYILDGPGIVHIEGVDYEVVTGDSVFVPAVFPHGVKTEPSHMRDFRFLAVGYPHHKVDSTTRMTVIR